MTDFSIGDIISKMFGPDDSAKGFDRAKKDAVIKNEPQTGLPKGDAKNSAVENEKNDPGQSKTRGVKIHVTKEYVKEHGTTIIGTKGNDVFIVDADVKNFKIRGNGGKDKVIIKKSLPKIDFPKLPNE